MFAPSHLLPLRAMTLIALLRGLNVGGQRRFRPSQLAQELRRYEVVNVRAAGTFVVRKPGVPAEFRAALLESVERERVA